MNTSITSTTGLPSNVAGALSYLLGPITGIVFLLIEKEDGFVRFHAAQSIIIGVAFFAVSVVLTVFTSVIGIVPILGMLIGVAIWLLMGLAGFVLWLFLMFQAFSHHEWSAPVLGEYARRLMASPAAQ
jgi:uncharacterized membrane protein